MLSEGQPTRIGGKHGGGAEKLARRHAVQNGEEEEKSVPGRLLPESPFLVLHGQRKQVVSALFRRVCSARKGACTN